MVKYISNVGTLAEFAISGHTVAIQFDLSIFSANVASWTVQTERERDQTKMKNHLEGPSWLWNASDVNC